MPIGILSILFILLQLSILNKIADEHTAYRRDMEEEKERAEGIIREPVSSGKQKLVYYTALTLFYVAVVPITITGKKVENYLEWQPLMLDLLKLIWIPVSIAWLYHKKWRIHFDKRERQDHVTIASFVIPLMALFHSIVWYNHLQPSPLLAREQTVVQRKGNNARYGNKYLLLNIKGEKKRFELSTSLYEKIREQNSIQITIKQGALGYAYIDSFIVLAN